MPAFQRLIRHPWALGLIGILTVLVLWWLTTASGSVNKLFLPSPQAVWQAGQQQWTSGLLLKDALASIQRVFIGFAMSAGLALPVGIAMGSNPVICRRPPSFPC
jgi:NitT/TauT family transport system permease protein